MMESKRALFVAHLDFRAANLGCGIEKPATLHVVRYDLGLVY